MQAGRSTTYRRADLILPLPENWIREAAANLCEGVNATRAKVNSTWGLVGGISNFIFGFVTVHK